jgi:hypothetical protein
MFDPIVVWSGVAALCGSLALVVIGWTHHMRLARLGAIAAIASALGVVYLGAFELSVEHAQLRPHCAVTCPIPHRATRHRSAPMIVIVHRAHRQRWISRTTDRVAIAPVRFLAEHHLLAHPPRAVSVRVYPSDDLAELVPWMLALGVATVSTLGAVIARRGWGWVASFASAAAAMLVLPLARPPASLALLWIFGTLAAIASVAIRGPRDHTPRF